MLPLRLFLRRVHFSLEGFFPLPVSAPQFEGLASSMSDTSVPLGFANVGNGSAVEPRARSSTVPEMCPATLRGRGGCYFGSKQVAPPVLGEGLTDERLRSSGGNHVRG